LKIERVSEAGDTVTLYYQHGKIELDPVVYPEDLQALADYATERDYETQRQALAEGMQVPIPAPKPDKPAKKTFDTLVEFRSLAGQWVTVGAYAATEKEITFWTLPGAEPYTHNVYTQINEATAPPLQLLDYLYQFSNGITVERAEPKKIKATSAEAAAQKAALRFEQKRLS
jgi:hypothetical protein